MSAIYAGQMLLKTMQKEGSIETIENRYIIDLTSWATILNQLKN